MHTSEAAVLGVSGRGPATQCLILGLPHRGGQMRAVGVSLPLGQAVRHESLPLLRPAGDTEAELPGTVGGLPGHMTEAAPEFLKAVALVQDARAGFTRPGGLTGAIAVPAKLGKQARSYRVLLGRARGRLPNGA